jgi:hypothetical protein
MCWTVSQSARRFAAICRAIERRRSHRRAHGLLGHLPGEEVDIAPVEYLFDLRERETDRFELLDRVECGALIEAVVPVARLSVDAYGDEQALLVVDAERLLRDTVQFSHLPYQQLAHGYLYW